MTPGELLAAGKIPLSEMDDFIKDNFKPTQTEPEPIQEQTKTDKKLKYTPTFTDPNKEMARSQSINGGRL